MKRLLLLLLCCLTLGSCVESWEIADAPGNVGRPDAQQGLQLCWAATTEYIMRYFNKPDHGGLMHKWQCELAYAGYWERNVATDGMIIPECTNVSLNVPPLYRDFPRYPFHGGNSGTSAMDYGYTYDFTGAGSSHTNPHLSFAEIHDEVLHNGPFIMAVYYAGGPRGMHFMIGSGFFWDGDRKLIRYWNTMPTSIYELGPPTPARKWTVVNAKYNGESPDFRIEVDGPAGTTAAVTHAYDLYHFRAIAP